MSELPVLTAADFTTSRQIRWCPGCGDYAVLEQFRQVLAELAIPREKIVLVSGVGCASRLPYYVNTYGFQTIHGQAPAIATGLKLANPDLHVWVITGDGDALAAGTNHFLHALRRNVHIKILLLNNEVFGLSRGQYSPTSRIGTRTKSSPEGAFETPLRPLSLALAAECSFVARSLDVEVNHLADTLRRAALHPGSALVEVYQNCKVFNDGVFDFAVDHATKADDTLLLEHGQPLIFGKDRNLGIRLQGLEAEVVKREPDADDLYVHDETLSEPTAALLLSRLSMPDFPECFGVFRAVETSTFEEQFFGQIADAKRVRKPAKLDDLLAGEESWTTA